MNPFNFLSNFYNMNQSNKIQELLKKPDVSLDEVLEQNDIDKEFKDGKDYVLKYFETAKFESLLNYLLKDHHNLEEKKKTFKFPQLASEIFSTSSATIFEFFQTKDEEGNFTFFEKLFQEFQINNTVKQETVNYTRAGYLQKIINNLFNSKPKIFVDRFLGVELLQDCLIKHCYSKSVMNLLVFILTLPSKIEVDEKDEEKKNWVKGTLGMRLKIFEKILEQAIQSSDKKEFISLNQNSCILVILVINQAFEDKEEFLKILFQNYIPRIVETFIANYSILVNDKIGNIFLLALNIILKENSEKKYLPEKMIADFADKYFELFQKSIIPLSGQKLCVTTFSKETIRINIKLFKLLETVLIYLKNYVTADKFEIFKKYNTANCIYTLFETYSMNNVLHHQLFNILLFIVQSKKKEVLEIFFFKNEKFLLLLQRIINEYQQHIQNREFITSGFIGYFKIITNKIKEMDLKDQPFSKNKIWIDFLQEFLAVEIEKEKEIFTDIDVNQNNNLDKQITYDFSMESIQEKYSEFLKLNEVVSNQSEDNKKIGDDAEGKDLKETLHKPSPHIDSEALREELKKMDLMNQEETAFQDNRYWKTKPSYEIDVLLSELHMS